MRRFFVTNLLFVIAVNALVKPAYILGIDRAVQVQVGPAAFGIYQALVSLGLVFGVLLDFGLANYNVRLIAAEPDKIREHFPPLLTVRLLLSAIYILAVSGIALALGYRGETLLLLFGILLSQVTAQALLFLRSCLSGLHRFKTDSLLSVADRVLMLVLCGILLQLRGFTLWWFVGAQIACYITALLVGVVLLYRAAPGISLRLSTHTGAVWAALKSSGPYALLTFLMAIYLRSDALLLERLSGAVEAGRYAAANRLLDVGQMFGLTFANMLLPLFGRQLASGEKVQPLVQTSVNLLLPAGIMVAVVGIAFGPEIMQLLYHRNDPGSGRVLGLLLAAFPAFCLTNVYSTLLTAATDLKNLNRIAAVGCAVSLSLNFWLLPRYGALSAACVALTTQWVVAIGYLLAAKRRTGLQTKPAWIAQHLSVTLVCSGTALFISSYNMSWIPAAGVICGAGIVSMFALGLFSPRTVRSLLRR